MKNFLGGAFLCVAVFAFMPVANAVETIRIGVLKFGTVNWELNAMKAHKIGENYGLDIEVVPFAGEDATNVALRAGNVDMIVSDWLDVSRARSSGEDLTFVPYSSSVGAMMVPAGSDIAKLADLKHKRIGVTGGPLDKSWLLIQGLAKRDFGFDLAAENTIVYGAPPLLTEKAKQGELDAVLTYWHFAARLEADHFRRLVSAEEAATALGASGPVSALGYVFSEGWATQHEKAVFDFVRATRDTKALLKESDLEWERLRSDGVIKDEGAALVVLRDRYREGIPSRPPAEEEADAQKLFEVLAGLGGEKLVGTQKIMNPGTYWSKLKNGF